MCSKRNIQEQKEGMKDMNEKMNAVLAEMQAVSLQVDLLSGGDMTFGPDTTEGAHWNLQDQKMEDQTAPPNVPLQPANVTVSAAGTIPPKDQTAAFPTFGTIVPPSVPPFVGNVGSFSTPPLQEKKNSPFGFEFPSVSAPAQGQNPSSSLFHNSGNANSPAQNKSFPNVTVETKRASGLQWEECRGRSFMDRSGFALLHVHAGYAPTGGGVCCNVAAG